MFLRDLTNEEVISHLLSNQAIELSRDGHLDDALARYDRALQLSPQLVVAHYNRGIDLVNTGRLEEVVASFGSAIEVDCSGKKPEECATVSIRVTIWGISGSLPSTPAPRGGTSPSTPVDMASLA